jgi:hypothetical protein
MGSVAGRRRQEKPRGAGIPETTWHALADVLVPGARLEIARLIRDVRTERRLEPARLRAWRTQRLRNAARVAGAVGSFLAAVRILRWVPRDALVDLEPETTTAFRDDLARFEAVYLGYLTRLRGRTEWLSRQREPRGRPSNALREVVITRLIRIAETYRRNPRAALLYRDRESGLPGGVLYEIAVVLRPWLSCLPSGDEALYKALDRALHGQK